MTSRAGTRHRRCSPTRPWCGRTPTGTSTAGLRTASLGPWRSWRWLAVDAMAAVFRRPVRERGIHSPTFCHGVAGLLQIALRFARDTQLPLLGEGVRALSDQLLEMNEPASLLGYRSFEPSGARVDQPGLLDGAPGVAMVLLAAAADVDPAWDRLFLLS